MTAKSHKEKLMAHEYDVTCTSDIALLTAFIETYLNEGCELTRGGAVDADRGYCFKQSPGASKLARTAQAKHRG
jgi:hypothetical protein